MLLLFICCIPLPIPYATVSLSQSLKLIIHGSWAKDNSSFHMHTYPWGGDMYVFKWQFLSPSLMQFPALTTLGSSNFCLCNFPSLDCVGLFVFDHPVITELVFKLLYPSGVWVNWRSQCKSSGSRFIHVHFRICCEKSLGYFLMSFNALETVQRWVSFRLKKFIT